MDTVFCIAPDEWQIRVNGKVRSHTFNSRGAALAGIQVERRRDAVKWGQVPVYTGQRPVWPAGLTHLPEGK